MIESLRDMTHMSSSYENLDKERTANKLFHRMEDRVNDDSLDATRARILGMSHHGPRHLTADTDLSQRTLERSTARIDVST
jgi:hypothetical protein